jgi:hypothetical protein
MLIIGEERKRNYLFIHKITKKSIKSKKKMLKLFFFVYIFIDMGQ